MKFRDPETGEVFDVSDGAPLTGFCIGIICYNCPIGGGHPYCKQFINEQPHEAARLMGYEVDDETEDSMFYSQSLEVLNPAKAIKEAKEKEANMDKPRICKVMGVDVGEQFYIADSYCNPYHITTEGLIEDKDGDVQDCIALDLINYPDRIIRKPRWTEQEVERAKAIKLIYPNAEKLELVPCVIRVYTDIGAIAYLHADLFPSMKNGQICTLDEIIGGAQ